MRFISATMVHVTLAMLPVSLMAQEPEAPSQEARDSAKHEAILEGMKRGYVAARLFLRDELAQQRSALQEYVNSGVIDISPGELTYLQDRLTAAIQREEVCAEAYRAELDQLNLKITEIGGYYLFENKNRDGGVTTYSWRDSTELFFDKWTGKPLLDREMTGEKRPQRAYRYDQQGNRYLFAVFDHSDDRISRIDVVDRDGDVIQRFLFQDDSAEIVLQLASSTGGWITWPEDARKAAIKTLSFLLKGPPGTRT